MVRAESGERVHRALEGLNESDREIVIQRGIEQQPLRTVAEHLGIEAGTAAVRFHRALKRLQQQLPDSAFADLEVVYDRLAEAIDRVGEAQESLFLAKLAMVLSHKLGDRAAVEDAIATALRDLGR